MAPQRILVLGGGFAGLWSAVGAARRLDELQIGPQDVEVSLVNRDGFHAIRVRNYEADLTPLRVPLDDVLGPIGVRRLEGKVAAIDLAAWQVELATADGPLTLSWDRLVMALGSQLRRPPIPGLAEHGFDVDTFAGAERLQRHLRALPQRPETPGRFTVVVVGAGLTGIEAACEMSAHLQVVLADQSPQLGSDMGDSARPVIESALAALGIATRLGVEVVAIDPEGVTLAGGERIEAATVLWCAGMGATPLNRLLPVTLDRLGRLPVDEFLRVRGVAGVFAAGDAACLRVDEGHDSVMSCQHSRPMGRFAGHNVVGDLLGVPMLPLRISWYATVLDLGPWGAVYTEGWDRQVIASGAAAKRTKQTINRERIYPPTNRDRRAILAAAAPVVQEPPPANCGD